MTDAFAAPTIFLVDDDPGVLRALARVLREDGWSVETFESAEAFLARPDPKAEGCLVLDVTMPGLDGLELQQQLAAAGEALPIVFISGHGDIPMSVRAIKAGATDFLTKPVEARRWLTRCEPQSSSTLRRGTRWPPRRTFVSDSQALLRASATFWPHWQQESSTSRSPRT